MNTLNRFTAATTPDARHPLPPAAATVPAGYEQGPLIVQTHAAARLARILYQASFELQDICALEDTPQMWEDARVVASRILAACEREE